eukprot:3464953-Pleurochrysis_carterae.AAC.1
MHRTLNAMTQSRNLPRPREQSLFERASLFCDESLPHPPRSALARGRLATGPAIRLFLVSHLS